MPYNLTASLWAIERSSHSSIAVRHSSKKTRLTRQMIRLEGIIASFSCMQKSQDGRAASGTGNGIDRPVEPWTLHGCKAGGNGTRKKKNENKNDSEVIIDE